jgi:hypothetical protein
MTVSRYTMHALHTKVRGAYDAVMHGPVVLPYATLFLFRLLNEPISQSISNLIRHIQKGINIYDV